MGVDSCDRARFNESKVELESLLTDEQLANCPVLILGNKIDRPGAAGEEELRQLFGLYGQTTGKGNVSRTELHGRPLELFMCSVLKRQGYGEGFRWISHIWIKKKLENKNKKKQQTNLIFLPV